MFDKQNQDQDEQEMIYEETEEVGSDEDPADLDVAKEKINKLKEKLKKCQEEKQGYLTGWQREKADFINYKRRQEEQNNEWLKIGSAGLVNDVLPVLDALDTAEPRGTDPSASSGQARNHAEGINLIRQQLWNVLKKYGLEEINCISEKFNPEFHEAVEQVELDEEEGIVVEEIQKGYLLNGKVLRTAKVKVARKL